MMFVLPVLIAMLQAQIPGVPAFPSPPPSISPVSERSLLSDRLDTLVAGARAKTGGTLGVVITDLGTGVTVSQNAESAFSLENVQKLPLAVAAYAAIDAGKLQADGSVDIVPADIAQTSGPIALAYAQGRHEYPARELIARMLTQSDGAAANALYRVLGGSSAINDQLQGLQIDGIVYRDDEASSSVDAAGTPGSVASMLSALETGRLLNDASRKALLATLDTVQPFPVRSRAGSPENTSVAAIVRENRRSIVIVAFLRDARGSDAERDSILASVGRLADDATRLFPMQ